VNAHLDSGMWYRYKEDDFPDTISAPENRFMQNELNYKTLLDSILLNENFPNICDPDSDTYCLESDFIIDMCCTVPSILIELNKFDEAKKLMEQCRRIRPGEKITLHAMIELMCVSLKLYEDEDY